MDQNWLLFLYFHQIRREKEGNTRQHVEIISHCRPFLVLLIFGKKGTGRALHNVETDSLECLKASEYGQIPLAQN